MEYKKMKHMKFFIYILLSLLSFNLSAHKYEDNTYQAVRGGEDSGVYVINQKTGTVKYCVSSGAVGEESFRTLCTKHTK